MAIFLTAVIQLYRRICICRQQDRCLAWMQAASGWVCCQDLKALRIRGGGIVGRMVLLGAIAKVWACKQLHCILRGL